MKEARVLLKATDEYVKVRVTDDSKPKIDESVLQKWESITTILARLLDARAGLINRLSEEFMEIFVTSNNDKNPYKIGACSTLGHGDYCEMVVGHKTKYVVENASKDEVWKDSLYVKYNFVSYYGLPLMWPDGEVFGTLCVIDDKENVFSDDFQI
jgi:GAF domain-containing protein